jgi:hypothetical protein
LLTVYGNKNCNSGRSNVQFRLISSITGELPNKVIPDQYMRGTKGRSCQPPNRPGGKQLIVPKVGAMNAHAHSSAGDTERNREELQVVGRRKSEERNGKGISDDSWTDL